MDLSQAHKESSVEFPRKNKFVICSETYEMRTITASDIKSLIKEAKLLVDDVYKVTSKNDGIFN